MRVVKYLIGVVGVAFALAHVVQGVQKLIKGTTAGEFTASVYAGHLAGMVVGTIVAIVCFRRPRKKR